MPPSRTSQQAHARPLRRDRQPPGRGEVERRRVAPQFADHRATAPAHLSPSSIAHSAARASRASTWMRSRRRQARRMDPPAFQDRHPLLHPQQRLAARRAGPAGSRPSRRRAGARRRVRTGSGAAARAEASARPTRLKQGRAGPAAEAQGRPRRRQGKALRHTTRQRFCSTFVLFPRVQGAGVNRATRRLRLRPGSGRSPRTASRVPLPSTPQSPCDSERTSTALSQVVLGPARRRRPDDAVAARPDRQRRHRRLLLQSRDRRIVDRMPGDPFVELPDVGVAPGSPHTGDPSVTTARTRSGSARASSRA